CDSSAQMPTRRPGTPLVLIAAAAAVCVFGCRGRQNAQAAVRVTMRIGYGTPPSTNAPADSGVRQLGTLMAGDSLLANTPDRPRASGTAGRGTGVVPGTPLGRKPRPNLPFHDGTPGTADLVARTLRKSANTPGKSIAFKASNIIAIDADGSDVVVVRLKEPNSFLLGDLTAVPIVAADNPATRTRPSP